MTFKNTIVRLAAAALLALPASAATDYSLNLSQGRFPKDIAVENANSLIPNKEGYKNGFTLDGWTVARSAWGYIAVSPTYTRQTDDDGNPLPAQRADNRLSLPDMELEAGDYLTWEACSIYPDFPESYCVKLIYIDADSEDTKVYEFNDERGRWTARSLRIDTPGKIRIQFVATSECRFMLGLRNVKVSANPAPYVCVTEPLSLSLKGGPSAKGDAFRSVPVSFRVINAGADMESLPLRLNVNGTDYLPADAGRNWKAGQEGTVSFIIDAEVDKKNDYALTIGEGADARTVAEGAFLCSDIQKKLFVDKGTGTWCNNCPDGNLALEDLERRFGSGVVAVETHTGSDPLANEEYFSILGFRAVPHFLLNRIPATKGSSCSAFEDYYFRPADAGIEVKKIDVDAETATVTVALRTAAEYDNSAGNFRIGHVTTGLVYSPENPRFKQQNNCNSTSSRQYFFLPSKIPAPLMKYHDVSFADGLSYNGVEGSLPAAIRAGEEYEYTFTVTIPQMLESTADGRINVYFIDSESGEMINCDSHAIEAYVSGIQEIDGVGVGDAPAFTTRADGSVSLNLLPGEEYSLIVTTIDGRHILSTRAVFNGETPRLPRHAGPAIVRIITARGAAAAKVMIR